MFEEIIDSIAEIQQPRSNFQLAKFVIGQHPTPEMQFYQTCLELQDSIHNYKLAEISVKKSQLKIEKLRASGNELDELKAQEIELGLEQTKLAMVGSEREIKELIRIYNSFEHKFTREEIESAQFDYWQARLTGNASAMLMGGQAVNYAHIESMKQAGVLDQFVDQVAESKKELGL